MQFIVFAAFAIVLSVPMPGPPKAGHPFGSLPWWTLHSPLWVGVIVIGQVVLAGAIGAMASWRVTGRLDRDPAWLSAAQHMLSRWSSALRFVLIGTFAASIYFTDWSVYVRERTQLQRIWGLDELLLLLPFLLAVVVAWVTLYPADRAVRQVSFEMRLWASQPGRPVWGLWSYLTFMFRHHVLIILAPMVPIVVTIDAVSSEEYGRWLRRSTGIVWADQAVLVAVAGLVFFVAPLFLRYIWQTQSLPAGDLRERLEGLCRRVGLRYRDILIWKSDGMVVNAAVMGLTRQVRYVLLSDGLLEMMDDGKIEAVFGHEAGHVKHHHITFYLLFAVLSMLIVGGISELIVRQFPWLLGGGNDLRDYVQVLAMGLIVAAWGIGFGPVSRRFEWQADLFGVQSATPSADRCDHPCMLHGTYGGDAGGREASGGDAGGDEASSGGVCSSDAGSGGRGAATRGGPVVCATSAHTFGEALYRIAVLNGIPVEARSWRHSSIANRIRLLKSYAVDPSAVARLNRSVVVVKILLVTGTVVGLAIGAWLYRSDFIRLWEKM